MKQVIALGLLVFTFSCSTKPDFDVNHYYDLEEQDDLLTAITTYLYKAPDGISALDRFKPEHKEFFDLAAAKFHFYKFYKADNGLCYYYIIRDVVDPLQRKRGAGGYFRMKGQFELYGFREVFVTPLGTEVEIKKKGDFLFNEMVRGDIEKYLVMKSYIEWPNEISKYDTLNYEWSVKYSN